MSKQSCFLSFFEIVATYTGKESYDEEGKILRIRILGILSASYSSSFLRAGMEKGISNCFSVSTKIMSELLILFKGKR